MKKNFLKWFIVISIFLCILGCATYSKSEIEEFISFPDLVFPEIMYYGANLGFFPPKARDFIMNTQFTQERMERPYMINPSLRVWWSEDNNNVLMEVSYIIADGYVGAGTLKTWGESAHYSGSSRIFDTYGKYAYYRTL